MKNDFSFFKRFLAKLVDDNSRKDFFFFFICAMNIVVLGVSGIHNFLNGERGLFIHSFCFCAFCILAVIASLIFKKHRHIVRYFFIVFFVVLSSYLLAIGGPKQALLYWVLLLPSFSFISFGLFEGTVLSVAVAIIIVVLYWTPLGNFFLMSDMLEAVASIKLRFTMIYLICAIFGSVEELIRYIYAAQSKLTNEKLEYSLLHCSLTNVANQRYLAKYIKEITNCKKCQNQTFGCLFIDIDNFKNVNDEFGHLFGNTVLRRIAEVLSQNKEAFVCRWGGDEFVVCFKGMTDEKLHEYADLFRHAVSEQVFFEHPKFKTSITIGVNSIKIDSSFNFNAVLELADKEMREKKFENKSLGITD